MHKFESLIDLKALLSVAKIMGGSRIADMGERLEKTIN
jgi:hypothetical protein